MAPYDEALCPSTMRLMRRSPCLLVSSAGPARVAAGQRPPPRAPLATYGTIRPKPPCIAPRASRAPGQQWWYQTMRPGPLPSLLYLTSSPCCLHASLCSGVPLLPHLQTTGHALSQGPRGAVMAGALTAHAVPVQRQGEARWARGLQALKHALREEAGQRPRVTWRPFRTC
jgi:hypothetical protein